MNRQIRKYDNLIDHSYDIPYIDSLEVNVPGVGRVSKNALDSIAKYADLANLPLFEALGLAAQETKFGAIPYKNFVDGDQNYNRILGNTSYFRNYGSIPAAFMVRDYHYYKDLSDEERMAEPPLLNAFNYYKSGKYNPGEKNHTDKVKNVGKRIIETDIIKNWMKESDFVK